MKPLTFLVALTLLLIPAYGAEIPDGYRRQELAPLAGELIMPEAWHYEGGMTPTGFEFVSSKEHFPDGHYDTGCRITGVMEISKRSGHTAKENAQFNLSNVASNAIKVLKTWKEEDHGFFRRIGVEVLEPIEGSKKARYHVMYSFFWNDDADMFVAIVMGSPHEEWSACEKTFELMGKVKLIDPEKAKNQPNQRLQGTPESAPSSSTEPEARRP
jgi:hypothetical protein